MKKQKVTLLLLFILILTIMRSYAVQTNIYQEKNFLTKATGEYISKPIKTDFNFDEAIISWNCKTDLNTGLAVYLRCGQSYGKWTNWYLMGQWSYTNLKTKNEQIKKDNFGKVVEDTLKLKNKYNKLQYKIAFFSKDKLKSPSVRLVTICYTDTKLNTVGADPSVRPSGVPIQLNKQLKVPYRSQCVEDKSISGKICGPTSLSMILEYYKIDILIAKTASFCYDKYNDIYGNWPYLVAFASEQGLTGWARYFTSLDELKEEIKNNYPVIVGISFGEGELTGSPVSSTAGHLLVVRGFDEEGNVYVNDPAFLNKAEGIRKYDKDEFAKAWLDNHLGIALVFRK